MTDFTKEELETIDYALETAHLGNSPLRKKILSLIDNYCEHENICFYYINVRGICVTQCIKCDEWSAYDKALTKNE